MSLIYASRVRETVSTTGTADFTLSGAVSGSLGFAARMANSDTCYYLAESTDKTEWEIGLGTFNSGVLERTTVQESSNSDAAVSFSAPPQVCIVLGAAGLNAIISGALPAGGLPGQAIVAKSVAPGDIGWGYPAAGLPTIVVPVVLGTGNDGAATGTNAFTTGSAVAAHGTILVTGIAVISSGATISSVSDGTANVYVPVANASDGVDAFICEDCLAVPMGNTITVVWSGGIQNLAAAIEMRGLVSSAVDSSSHADNSGAFGTNDTSVQSSGTLAQPNEILIGLLGSRYRSAAVTYPAGWTPLVHLQEVGGNDVQLDLAYMIVFDKTSRDFSAHFVTGCYWSIDLVSFKGA